MGTTDNFKKSYQFFIEKEKNKESFQFSELQNQTTWSKSTLDAYKSKKWQKFLTKVKGGYIVSGIANYSEEEYLRYMSQTQKMYTDFTKPRLDSEVEKLVIKAKESALLAIDIYNRPATSFKSEGFIVMLIIAWTSLLHAIFQKKGIDYFYLDNSGNKIIIDGDYKAWELTECLKQYFQDNNSAITSNLNFLIGLRNRIEHRYVPTIDIHVVGECQAALFNFDELIVNEFGNYYAIKDYLSVPLQTSNIRTEKQIEIQKQFQGKQYSIIKEYIDNYREQLEDQVYQDPKYSFRVFLIPKLGNHKKSSDLALEFIKYDPNNPEDMKKYNRQIALMKEKKIPVINPGKLRPGEVAQKVESGIGRKFSVSYHHPKAYKHYKIRSIDKNFENCNTKFCQFDDAHKDFIYTEEWVEFLIDKLKNEEEYFRLFPK